MPSHRGFVNPGHNSEPRRQQRWRESNSANEYDALGDQYAQLLIGSDPEIAKTYKLTSDPEGRAICGASSGGIAAFTAAWERPDYFRKVISHIGSFVSIRGGHVYPTLVRQAAKRPIRVFLQGGSNDLDNRWGNGRWQPVDGGGMKSAVDYRFEFGMGHTHKRRACFRKAMSGCGGDPNPLIHDPLSTREGRALCRTEDAHGRRATRPGPSERWPGSGRGARLKRGRRHRVMRGTSAWG